MQNLRIRKLIVAFLKARPYALCCLYSMLTACHQRLNFPLLCLLITLILYLRMVILTAQTQSSFSIATR